MFLVDIICGVVGVLVFLEVGCGRLCGCCCLCVVVCVGGSVLVFV